MSWYKNLFHGSKVHNLTQLKPKSHILADGEAVVFATPDVRFALAMCFGTGEEIGVGYYEDTDSGEKEMYIEELRPNAFDAMKNKASLYIVDPSSFKKESGLMAEEVISHEIVDVKKEIVIPNVYNQLRKLDVNMVEYGADS